MHLWLKPKDEVSWDALFSQTDDEASHNCEIDEDQCVMAPGTFQPPAGGPLNPNNAESFNPNNPYVAIALLGERVNNIGKEKEMIERSLEEERRQRRALEDRIVKMEISFQRGAGILMVLPIVGGFVGFLAAYWKAILAPWIRP